MGYLNGKQVFLSGEVNGLVDIKQHYDPESPDPLSGAAVAKAVKTALVFYEEATFDSLRDLVNEGKYVVLFGPDESGGIAYYTLFYDIEHILAFGAVEGAAVKTISFYEGNKKTEQTTSLLSTQMVQQKYLPDSEYPISGKGVAEAMAGVGGDCVVYLAKDEANYELLKGYIDAGKTVIIKDDSSYLYLSAYDDDYVSFYSVTGGNYGYIDYYSNGSVEEYWSPAFVNTEDVQHDYDANSNKPISGQGVAKALETVPVEQPLKLIQKITLTEAVTSISTTFDKPLKELWVRFVGSLDGIEATVKDVTLAANANNGTQYFFWINQCTFQPNKLNLFTFHSKEVVLNQWETRYGSSGVFPAEANQLEMGYRIQGLSAHSVTEKVAYSTRNEEQVARFVDGLKFMEFNGKYSFSVGSKLEIWGVEGDEE